jgi:hypothetical protein
MCTEQNNLRGLLTWSSLLKDENCDLFAYSNNILDSWGNFFSIIQCAYRHWRYEDEYIEPNNGSKHYQDSVSTPFLPESNFDFLLSFPNTWTVTHF